MALNKIKINDTTTVNTGVVYDITKATGQSYDSLSAALGTNGNNVPLEIREGGMSIRFVLTSDNKYVQYRLMSDIFNTTPANWQGVDEYPIAMSKNLVESSGIKQSQYPYEAISLLYNTSTINLGQYEKSEGSFSSFSSKIIWTKDGYNRYHKCVPIPNDKKKVFIQANNNINSRIVVSTDYDSSATSGSTISVADGFNKIIVTQAGENVILDIPSNGNYLLVEVNSNSIDESPYSIIFFENDDNKSDVINNIPFIVTGAITKTSNGNIDTSSAVSNYRTTDFFLLKKGGAVKVKSDCNPTIYPISVFSAKDASTQLLLESVIGSVDNTIKEYVYINKTSADVYVRVSSHKNVIDNETAYIKVDNFGYTEIPSLLHKRELPKFANLSYDYNGVTILGSTSASTGYVKIKKDDKIIIKNGSYCHTVMIFKGTYQAGDVVREDPTANRIYTDEMFSSPCDGYLFVRFFDATNVNLPVVIDNFNGTVEIYTLEEQVKKNLLPTNIRVATYNTGDFRKSGNPPTYGTDELAIEMRNAIMSVGANLIGTQEDLQYFNTQQESSVYEAIYKMYPKYYREGKTMYNYKGLLGVYDVNGLSKVMYYGSFTHSYFLSGEVNFNGRKTLVVSIHLDWQDRDRRVNQIQQLIDYCKRYEYYIILGDFNPDNRVNEEVPSGEEPLRYEQDLEYFINAGMNIANANYLGIYTTFYDENIPVYPCDNIVTSPNITIYRIGVEKREYMDDHYIFWADITIE